MAPPLYEIQTLTAQGWVNQQIDAEAGGLVYFSDMRAAYSMLESIEDMQAEFGLVCAHRVNKIFIN